MDRPIADKYLEMSEAQSDEKLKAFYWSFAEEIDEAYSIYERAMRLADRNLILRIFAKIEFYKDDEEKLKYWVKKIKTSNSEYDKRFGTEGV